MQLAGQLLKGNIWKISFVCFMEMRDNLKSGKEWMYLLERTLS